MFSSKRSLPQQSALPSTVIQQENDRHWLCQPGVGPGSVLSLHTQQGRRVRQATHTRIDLNDLPAGNYLLRVQLPDGAVHVLPVQLP